MLFLIDTTNILNFAETKQQIMAVKILLILGVLMYYFGRLLNWLEDKQDKTYKFRNADKPLDINAMKQCSAEQKKLVKIFHGSTAVKHPRAWEIHAEEDPLKRELALVRILLDVWQEFPYMVEKLRERERKLIAQTTTVVVEHKNDEYGGGYVEWDVKY